MYLTIDIGNSALKFAVFDREQMTTRGKGVEELNAMLANSAKFITRSMISSVSDHGHITDLLKKLNIPFQILSPETPLPIRNLYLTPETLGADRLTLAVAAYHLYDSSPALVIGAGTCITYDLVDSGSYYGGAISPGITMRFQALQHYTSRLPYVDWDPHKHVVYEGLVGTDSKESIMSGVLHGTLMEVDGTIDEYKRRYNGLQVAVTGGDMDFLVKNLKNDIFARPDMVLEGLNYILLNDA